MRYFSRSSILLAAVTAACAYSLPASAQDRTCRGVLGAVWADTVTVPSGAVCTLSGTRVRGDVIVNSNATLRTMRAIVLGNIKSSGGRSLAVSARTRIAGNIEWQQSGAASVVASDIDGDIKFEQNRGALSATDNTVDGDIFAEKNRGGFLVRSNVVQGNLKCKENIPAPTGGRNIVEGNKEGQCARL
jgi:hypothetical protein